MKNKMTKLLACLVLSTGITGTANAVMIDFNFTGNGGAQDSYSFTESGLTATATASYDGIVFDGSARVHQSGSGLGVDNDGWLSIDSNTIDGRHRDDHLTLTFDATVEAIALDFGSNSGNDEFDFYVDGEKVLNNQETTPDGWITLNLGMDLGDTFTIRANQNNDNFRVEKMRVSYNGSVGGPAPAPVPEPSTYAMFGTAFAILAFVGYRKRRAA